MLVDAVEDVLCEATTLLPVLDGTDVAALLDTELLLGLVVALLVADGLLLDMILLLLDAPPPIEVPLLLDSD